MHRPTTSPLSRLRRLAAGALLAGAALAAHATGAITTQASVSYVDMGNNSVTLQSNIVTALYDDSPPTISFYTDATYSHVAGAAGFGKTLYVGITAHSCNREPGVSETMAVDLWSLKMQRKLTVTAVESAPDSGLFRFALTTSSTNSTWTAQPLAGASDTLPSVSSASTNDVVQAEIEGCGSGAIMTRILIDPSGVVFDSATNAVVAGITVTLVDVTGAGNGGLAGGAARVFADDGTTPAPSTVVSDTQGRYTFPVVAPSQYRLDIVPPADYKYPTTLSASALPSTRHIDANGSFHRTFVVDPAIGNMLVDLPLDETPHAMSVTKTASRTSAEIAESVGYTVVVRNVGNTGLDSVSLRDTLPVGFAYLPHSATIDGTRTAEPAGGRGPVLDFEIPAVAAGQTRTLSYRATIGAVALDGDGVNHAQARATLPFATVSNVAAAAVQVQQGVFTDRAMVLGKVYADCNGNGLQDAGEPGVPGVRLLMEDGSFVITDGDGRYSFYGISPRTHVLKIDATTLPPGTTPMATSQRNAGDGASRFVDPHRGELHRADFALSGCSKALDAVIKLRAHTSSELGAALKMDFRADGAVASVGDVRAQPATGVVGEAQGEDGTRYVTIKSGGAAVVHAQAAPAPEPTLAQRLESLDDGVGFIDLEDGQVLASTQATVRVKGPSSAELALAVDGQDVPAERIGTRVQDDARHVQARDYVGVPLSAGDHVLTLTARDPFGNVRGSARVTVRAPGELAHLAFELPATRPEADGQTAVPVVLALTDARGVPVTARTAVTLDTSLGEWDVVDADPREPGVQTFVEGGRAEFRLRAPHVAGTAELRATSGKVTTKASLSFVPALRPMVAAGIVEGALNLHRLRPGAVVPASTGDGFEAELDDFATSGDKSAGARAALYLKGKVLGSSLLTVGYDSAKESDQTLFRDIQPDQFYPIYGDSSTKGFDAQSTSHLYVRLEHDKSYVLYGDFTTQDHDPARQLGAYQRSLTGAKAHVEAGPVATTAFASQATSSQVVDEIAANGTSGPFMLAHVPVANSEKIEVLVRDRNQPALVVSDTALVRFTDYDIDALTGRLLLRAPVPSLDANMNPESIRVTYEASDGGPTHLVAGADAKLRLGDHVQAGIALVMDKDPLDTMQMGSASVTYKPDEHTSVTVEGARTAHDAGGRGDAGRIELKHDDDKLKVQAQAAHTDATFDNPSAMIAKGRDEANLKASYALDEKTRLVVDAAASSDVTTGDRREGVLVGAERSLPGGAKLEVGTRHVRDVPGTDATDTTTGTTTPDTTTTTVRAKLSAPVPGVAKATAYAEAEEDIRDADKRLLAVGGDYRITPSSRVYARQEIISSLSGELSLDPAQRRNATLFGIDSDVTHDTHLFSEYRVQDAIDGREAEAAMGLRNQWSLAEGVRLNTTFERVKSLSGGTDDDSVAATAAIEYTRDPLSKATGRVELRDGSGSRGVLSTLGLARKIDADWTLLGRNAFALTESKTGAPTQVQERFQLGVAYRDTRTNRVNGLARYEFKREDGGTDFEHRLVHVVSSHADYQIDHATIVTGEYAAKHELESVDGRWIAGNAQLISARATRDLGTRWDLGLAWRVLADASFSSRSTGVGAELGWRAIENLWLSLGYNLSGFRDRDLADDNTTQAGAYVRLRFKFDESLFGAQATAKAAP